MAFLKSSGHNPARIGTVSPALWPAKPWQAEQLSAFMAPGLSSGPAPAVDAAARTSTILITTRMGLLLSDNVALSDHVVPNGPRPPERILSHRDTLPRRQLLLDLDNLAVLDPVRVDHRDRLAVVDPRVAGVARGELRRPLAVELVDDGHGRHLAHGVGDVSRLRHRQPDRRVTDDVDGRRLDRLVRQ